MEKIVATPTKEYIWVVDASKMVDQLVPSSYQLEVVQYGADRLYRVFFTRVISHHLTPTEQTALLQIAKNYIIDLDLG